MKNTLSSALLVASCAAVAGCSSDESPTTPTPAAPAHFVVFTSDRTRAAGAYHNYITDLDASGATEFTFGTATGIVDQHPSITSDGNLLVFQSSPGRGGSQDVFGFNRVSGALTDDDNVNTAVDETDPYLSLNGQRLAFVRDSLGYKRIRLYYTRSRTFETLAGLVGASGDDWQPALDETGAKIAFVSDRDGNADVFVYDVASHGLRTLPSILTSAGDDVEPSISGNGRYVVFASNRTGGLGGYDLYMLDLTNNQPVALAANSAANDRDPTVSYDGSRIQFVSDRAGGSGRKDLWLYDRGAGTVLRVTNQNSASDDFDPVIVWK